MQLFKTRTLVLAAITLVVALWFLWSRGQDEAAHVLQLTEKCVQLANNGLHSQLRPYIGTSLRESIGADSLTVEQALLLARRQDEAEAATYKVESLHEWLPDVPSAKVRVQRKTPYGDASFLVLWKKEENTWQVQELEEFPGRKIY